MVATTPKTKIIALYEQLGYQVADVEHLKRRRLKIDLWGFADVMAIREPDERFLIQVCLRDDRRKHFQKLLLGKTDPLTPGRIRRAIKCGFQVYMCTWLDNAPPVLEEITLPMLDDAKWWISKLKPLPAVEP